MDLVERSQYKTSKNELGLSVNNIERRLLNISHNELDEDMIIKVAMLEAADTGELESSGKKKLHQQNESKRNASNFFYEENSEFSEKKSNSKLKWEERENQLVPKYVGEQEAEPRRRKRKTDSNCNSIGQMGSSSNRVFEKRRSSSKSEVETARFNKVEGLTSSRNLDRDSKALSSRREMERFRNKSDFTPEQAHKTAEPPLYSSNTPLLNTFSTIKPTDQFDFINNSSTKNQKGMLTQLEKQIKSYHLEDTFEFTELESKNQSVHARKCFPGTLTQTSYETNKNLKASLHKDTQSTNVGLKSMKTMTSQEGHGDRSKERAINLKIEDHLKNQSRQSKRSLKNSMDMTGHSRKKSKSKDCMTKRVTENISKIIESINKSVMGGEATKEEQAILDALAGLHVFEFKNACVLGLDLRDLGDVFKATEGTLLNSVYFKQLVNNIGILRIRNSSITGKFINAVSHSNIILLSINQCGLTSLTHISHLSNLKLLNASDNHLKNMSGIQKCSNLTELYANNNQLASLHELKGLQGLKVLSVCYNIISDVSEFQYLRRNTQLGYLKVLGNPICYMKEYHSTIFNILPKLKRIDYFDIEVDVFNPDL